ncbi:predicted protein [Naegleria gruberi]|uniref:Predicted protein n=1 Tax=Naegleria gruberi TaxID=5762 RepID=D2VRU2_NAEGR|nr:uncharacterized protein NAEGRDRAFT_71704 [Naegleria gruberi]EFC40449.1 predicted protein [Naegleria gruberi]|eukprot:XP_002673193.1 predicted protein [Naegleria gruberi strain NEG-M]
MRQNLERGKSLMSVRKFRESRITMMMIGMLLLMVVVGLMGLVSADNAGEKKERKNVWIFTQPLFYDQFKPLVDHLVNEDKSVVTVLTPYDASDAFEQFLTKRRAGEEAKFNLVKCPIDTRIPTNFYSSIIEPANKKQTYYEYATHLKHQWIDTYFGKSFYKCGSSQLEKSKVDVVVTDCHAFGAMDFASSFSKPLVILCPTLAGLSTIQPVSHQTGKELFEPRFNPFNQVSYLKLFNQMIQLDKTSSYATTMDLVTRGQFLKQNSTDFIRSMNEENLVGQFLNIVSNMFSQTQYQAFWLYELFLNNRRSEYLPMRIADDTSILDIVKTAHVFYTSVSGVTEDSSLRIPSNAHLIPPLLIKQTKWINVAEKRLSEVKTLEKKMENRNVILVNLRDSFKLLPLFLNNLETIATKHNHLVIINKNGLSQEIISKYPSFVFSDLRAEERNRILKSSSIRFVITSGDLLSTSEVIAHGKPVLMVPSTTEGFAVSLQLSGNLKIGHVLIPSFTNEKVIQDVMSNFLKNTELYSQVKITKQYSDLFSEGSNMSVNILSSYILSLASNKNVLSPSYSFDTKAALIVDTSIVAICILLTLLIIIYINIKIMLRIISLLCLCCVKSTNKPKKEKTE